MDRDDRTLMGESGRERERVWSIVLAGGDGERLRAFTEQWLGRHVPKQYCTFAGTRSMLQHTWDRVAHISVPERTLTVVARAYQEMARAQLVGRPRVDVIAQPSNRNTAAGILLPLTYVRRRDPDAMVVVFPSDHFVWPEARFVRAVRDAVAAADQFVDKLVVLGVVPDGLEVDYGWIVPGEDVGRFGSHAVRSVRSFLEKPERGEAMKASALGAVWNTMVMAGRAETFWALTREHLPEIIPPFERLLEAIDTRDETRVLNAIYEDMPARNFSSDLLQRTCGNVAVLQLEDVMWSDWGRAERIVQTLRDIGKPAVCGWPLQVDGAEQPFATQGAARL